MSLGSKDVGNEFVNGQERSFAARKQHITNLKTPLFQLLKSLWVKCPKTFRLEGVSHFFTLSPFHSSTYDPLIRLSTAKLLKSFLPEMQSGC